MQIESELLLGILALQLNFIDRSQLLLAFDRWTLDKSRPLAEYLIELGFLSPVRQELLESLRKEHLTIHGGDCERSIAAVGATIDSSLRESLNHRLGFEHTLSFAPSSDVNAKCEYSTVSHGVKSERGRFQILRPHAEGGLGIVSVAIDGELHREVAFKEIKPERAFDTFSRSRFVLEAEITGRLEHPGIVPVYGLGAHEDGRPFYAMRFVKGDDLRQAIRRLHEDKTTPSMLETRKLLARFLDVCRAIHYAHSRGVLHRDLKPANVMLGKFGETLVVDWGLAKVIGRPEESSFTPVDESVLHPASASGSEPTMLGAAIGTPGYMSPEQAEGRLEILSPASDVFSLGIILYELLTGVRPFAGEHKAAILERVRRCEYQAPRNVKSWIPKPLEAICVKALSKRPEDRYASTDLLAADIEAWLADEPVSASRESLFAKARRWAKRHPGMVATFVSMLLLGSISAVLIAWQQSRHAKDMITINHELEKERIKANEETQNAKQSEARERAAKEEERAARADAEQQRLKANQQKELAEESEKLARNQAVLALESIQFVLQELNGRLRESPGTAELRIRILDIVSKKWAELDLELTGGIRGKAIPTMMALRVQVAQANTELDRLEEADQEYSKAYDLSAERMKIDGDNNITRLNRAKVGWAWSKIKGRLDGNPLAEMALVEESELLARECLEHPGPDSGEVTEVLLAILQQKAFLYLTQGRLGDAEKCYAEALQLQIDSLQAIRSASGFASLSQNEQDERVASRQINRDKLAIALAYICMRLERRDESLALFEKTIAGCREIYERHKASMPLKESLAGLLMVYGRSLLWIGQLGEAYAVYGESLILWEEVFDADRKNAHIKRQVSVALYQMATIRDLQGDSAEAASLQERCRVLRQELMDGSDDKKNRINLMLIDARCGRFDAASRLIDDLGKTEAKDGELHLERARALAQLSRHVPEETRIELKAKSIVALERAINDGYSDPFRIRHEPDLAPIRSDPLFSEIVARLDKNR